MPRPRDLARRDDLLGAVIDTIAARGLGSRSLRDIASDVGTSHRMLLHHFGTREQLLVAVVDEVEARQARLLTQLDGSASDRIIQLWAHLSAPAMRALERLFFESYSRGASGEAPFDRLLPDAVHMWLRRAAAEDGADHDPALARLGLAVIRGLLLDLVATGDRAGTTRALERFVEMLTDATSATPTAVRLAGGRALGARPGRGATRR